MTVNRSDFRADFARYYFYTSGSRFTRTLRCWLIPGLQAVAAFRFGQWSRRLPLLLRIITEPLYLILNLWTKGFWGIELQRSASIGRGLYIGHFGGITVSGRAQIGKNCNLSQSITIGSAGQGENEGVPVIGENVYIAPGARLFGKITIGNNVKIGANTVVYRDVPDNAVLVLDPGFTIVSYKGNPNPNQVE